MYPGGQTSPLNLLEPQNKWSEAKMMATLNRDAASPSRGEVYSVCLDPVFGREMGGFKQRPVVILSINDLNSRIRIVIVVPGTSTKSLYKNVVSVLPTGVNGLTDQTYFQCHQLRAIDSARLLRKIGILSPDDCGRIALCVAFCLGLSVDAQSQRV